MRRSPDPAEDRYDFVPPLSFGERVRRRERWADFGTVVRIDGEYSVTVRWDGGALEWISVRDIDRVAGET